MKLLGQSKSVRRRAYRLAEAFTLLELLVVFAIMGLLAAIAIPSMKGSRNTNAFAAANSQLVHDLNFARKRAINERTTVYMLFMPPVTNSLVFPNSNDLSQRAYRFFAERTVGDQPGRPSARFLTGWIKLPEGVLIPTGKFSPMGYTFSVALQSGTEQKVVDAFNSRSFPLSKISDPPASYVNFPYIAFNSQGGLIANSLSSSSGSTVIPLLWPKAQSVNASLSQVTDNYNHIVIDGLTGRTRVDTPEIE